MSYPISPRPRTAIAGYSDQGIFSAGAKPRLVLVQGGRGMAALLATLDLWMAALRKQFLAQLIRSSCHIS